ncbi:MAG: NFACT family protein [Spirochaetales bacterium]
MSLNWKEINLILQELPWEGSRIQEIRQNNYRSLILELYHPKGPWKLYISVAANSCRLHRLTQKPPSSPSPKRFVELLRSRIRGGKILKALQPGNDRIVVLEVQRGGDTYILWIRLWGPASNILLTEKDGKIIDAFYRRPKQGEITGSSYAPFSLSEPSISCPTPRATPANPPSKTYEIRSFPAGQSFNTFIEEYYTRIEEEEALQKLKADLEKQFNTKETRLQAKLKSLLERKKSYQGAERYRQLGDLILSYLHTLQPNDRFLSIRDTETGGIVEIPLDPSLTPAENAEQYFRKYKKAKAGLQIVEEEIESLQHQLKQLKSQRQTLLTTKDLKVLTSFAEPRGKKTLQKETTTPGLSFSSHGFTILVGRTAQENDELLRKHVRGKDFWLHTRDYPGAYVFIRSKPGKSIPLETLLDAGYLAVYFSKARESESADLYYTQVKYLRRAKGEKLGTVLPTQEKNLYVKIDPKRLSELLGQ